MLYTKKLSDTDKGRLDTDKDRLDTDKYRLDTELTLADITQPINKTPKDQSPGGGGGQTV